MRFRILILLALSGAMAFGGYQVSHLRAGVGVSVGEVLAHAGGEPGFLGGAENGNASSESYRISALSVFSNVALHVKDNYVEPSRIKPKEMLIAALNEIERQVAEVLVEEAGEGKLRVRVPGHSHTITADDVESLWEINLKLRDVFRFFEKHLPPQKDMRAVEYAAINGALSTLDPHSVLLKPEAFAEMKTSTKGEFGGLGIVISIRDAKLTIISPLDGTPASRAGLRAMDVITRIGDVSTVSMPIEEAVQKLRGPEGSKVTIWVERKGWPEARKFVMTREKIKIESIESRLLDNGVGYVKVKNFQQNTGQDLADHVNKLQKKAGGTLKGLVVDLRNNPGGLLEQAIRVSDEFLSSGDIVTTVGYGNKLREPKRAQWSSSDRDETPLVVLVNNGSASASEIVAGALKNLDRAVIVGERTFGKGSVQVLYDFADSSALKLTIAQYLTPGGISIQGVGVTPDVELKPAVIDKANIRLFWEPEGHREMDLDKHLERANTGKTQPDPSEQKPDVELTYLMESKKAADEDAAGTEEEAPEEAPPADTFEEDYPIKLAREMLSGAGKAKRSDMLKAAATLLEKKRQEEEAKISQAITGLGIEWAPSPQGAPAAAKPSVSVDLKLIGGGQDGRIPAGTEVTIEAKVTNNGAAPLHRVRGHLETDHNAFRGRELLFGTIAPGASKTWSVSTKIAKEAASRSDILTLKLSSDQGPIEPDAQLPVATQYAPHPQFAYSWAIDDQKRGDGDGVLERGEGADFMVFVTNVGNGNADAVALRLKSGAGEDLFLERGRVEIGAIKSGETRIGRLRFKVRPNQTPNKTDLPLELTIYDSATGEWLEDELAVTAAVVKPAKAVKKTANNVLTRDALLYAAADPESPVLGTLPKGSSFKSTLRVDDFLRLELGDENFAWVRSEDVRSGSLNKKLASLATIGFHSGRRPPSIEIEGQLGGRVVDGDNVLLSGTVTGRQLRDMYIVVNDKKVFYADPRGTDQKQPGPQLTSETKPAPAPAPVQTSGWAPPDERAVVLPFKHTLPLNDGLNKILVVARLDEKVITYRSLFVSRMRRSSPAVAEAQADSKPAPSSSLKPALPRAN